ncbi:hypothetical protein Tco_0368515 [Tanacetum coccineum]
MRAPLRARFKDIPTSDMKEILLQRMLEENYDKGHEDHKMAFEALQKSIIRDESEQFDADKAEEQTKNKRITELTPEHLEGPAYEVVKAFHPDMIHLQFHMEECHKLLINQVDEGLLRYNVSRPLPLGGPPGMYTIQTESSSTKDLEYLRILATKGDRLVGVIHKDESLPLILMPARTDDGGSRDSNSTSIDTQLITNVKSLLSTHMMNPKCRLIEVFSLLRSPEPPTAQRQEDSLYCRQLMDKEFGYQKMGRRLPARHRETQPDSLNLTKPRWEATGLEDKYGVQMIMRFNEIHKFSDGTLQQIDEALDYRVKEFRVNRMNPGLDTRFWTKKDVDRSKEFMFAIQKRLKTRRIFRNLESFVGGRIREGDYRLLKRTE